MLFLNQNIQICLKNLPNPDMMDDFQILTTQNTNTAPTQEEAQIPRLKDLNHMKWDRELAMSKSYVTWNKNIPYIDGKEIVYYEDRNKRLNDILRDIWEPLPPSTGRDRVFAEVSRKYIGLSKTLIMSWLKKQVPYQRVQPVYKVSHTKNIVPKRPFQTIQTDVMSLPTSGDYSKVLIVVDAWSKYQWARPMKTDSTAEVKRAIKSIFDSFPKGIKVGRMLSDNGPSYKSREFAEFMKKEGITHVFVRKGSPQSNGLSERVVKQISTQLYSIMSKTGNRDVWPSVLQACVALNNRNKSRTTLKSPEDLLEVDDPTIHKEIEERIESQGQKQKFQKYRIKDLEVGDVVRVSYLYSNELGYKMSKDIAKRIQKKGGAFLWSMKTYRVARKQKDNFYLLEGEGRKKFPREALQKIDS